ncbi:acetylserotonin O-methyltransferase [Meriones unguiculatus]|uniref:acetylserotonin O-methyltransferase n=1 Tax=Meriones unguiculatus TaxID=10047 RepID=UPI000B4EAFA4|nr:acetylserotonin O-methyltransferase [Meriones unguiculatus]
MASEEWREDETPEDRDFRVLMEYAHGFMVSQVVFSACDLGVFDVIAASGTADVGAIARATGSSPCHTRLLLEACVELGMLRVGPDGTFANTRLASSLLVAGSPRCQRHMMLYLAGTPYRCWGQLGRAVREGRSQYGRAVGVDTEEPFAAIYRSEPERLLFMRALQETWSVCGGHVLTAFDLSPFRVVCDVGGGSGALACELARLYPGSDVTVFDTPEVIAAAQAPPFQSPGIEPVVHFLGGDFFRSRLPAADLYILARVLHDWTDEACAGLLGRISMAGGAGTALLLVEALMPPEGDPAGPVRLPALLLSLNMAVQTRGRERTEAEYQALTAGAGFSHFRVVRTRGPYATMLAWK